MSFYCFVNWALCSSMPAAHWHKTVPNPDLEIRGGDPVIQRPLDKGGSPKKFFQPFRPKFGLKIRVRGWGWAPSLDQPLQKHNLVSDLDFFC